MSTVSFGILIVDDEVQVCRSLSEILTLKGYRAQYETDPLKVLAILESRDADLVLLDIRMPQIGGIDLLRMIKKHYPTVPVIVISGHATVDNAVRAMKYGALNLFTKPIKTSLLLKEISQIRQSMEQRQLIDEATSFVSEDPRMKQVLTVVETVAPTQVPVLITGESGTGKEMIANSLHALSGRRDRPLIKVNCASIPETLLESEMFGHEKGAFTDAKEQRKGLFELASGGSMFLDEIADINLNMQAKLLRVLQDGKFLRLGGSKTLRADCRIIAATNQDLGVAISRGAFREDLYYRLAVVGIHLPPLRNRKQDILALAHHFLAHHSRVYGKNVTSISSDVETILLSHSWPGNIRELKNFMERAVIFAHGDSIESSDIPDQYRDIDLDVSPTDLHERYSGAARDVIIEALSRTKGVKQDAARLLRIDRKTLYNQMKKLKLL